MKTKKTKEAISLIVLVLTIVIMIVLTGVIISNLSNNGIINRGKTAVSATNLKQVQELATVAWGELVISNVDATIDEEAIKEKLKENGIEEKELENYYFNVSSNGVKVTLNRIPSGGVYYTGVTTTPSNDDLDFTDTTKYVAGDKFPTPQYMDVYIYEGFTYIYKCVRAWGDGCYGGSMGESGNVVGWNVDAGPVEGRILSKIAGKPVTNMECTYSDIDSATDFSKLIIPESITHMISTFACTNIAKAPIIPSSVIDMTYAFEDASIVGDVIINANPDYYGGCFADVDMSKLTLKGTSTMLQELADTVDDPGYYG